MSNDLWNTNYAIGRMNYAEASKINTPKEVTVVEKKVIVDNRGVEIPFSKFISAKQGNPIGYEPGPTEFFSYYSGESGTERPTGRLTWEQMRLAYLMVPPVSICINGIAREIANMKWSIVKRDESVSVPDEVIRETTRFFQNPNRMKRPFSQMIYVVTKALGIYSRSAIENVFLNGRLAELFVRDASTIIPLETDKGMLYGYRQELYDKRVDFNFDQLVFIEYNPDDYGFGGGPILDNLVSVNTAIVNSIEFIAKSLNYNQIPPGVFTGFSSQKQAEGFMASMKQRRSAGRVDQEMTALGGVTDFQWIEFKRASKDAREIENLNKMERIVRSAYGVTSLEAGEEQDVNRSTAFVMQDMSQSKLIVPMCDLLADELNAGILWKHIDDRIKIISEPNVHRMREKIIEENKILIPLGQRTINEGRRLLRENAVPGGDNAIFVVGGTVIKVKDLDKETVDVNALNVSQPSKNQSTASDKVVSIKEDKKKTAAEISQIFYDKKKRFLSGYIAEYFKKNGDPERIVKEIENFIFQKLNMETKLSKYVLDAIVRYEKYPKVKTNHEERLNLGRELIKAYDITLYETKKGIK